MHRVLMPAYNAERFVAEAIRSVLAQTEANLELLIIDDGSTDGTLAIVRDHARRDGRIRWLTQANQGIAHTLNRGLRMLDGEWVFLMHADDVMMPHRIARQAGFIRQNPDLSVACSLVQYINADGRCIGMGRSRFTSRAAVAQAARRGEFIGIYHPACALRRAAVLGMGGYRQAFWPSEDSDLWMRMAEAGHAILVQDEVLLRYRLHGASATTSQARLNDMKVQWIERCSAARRNGEAEPSWSSFQAERAQRGWLARLRDVRREWGRAFYQAGVHHFAARNALRCLASVVAAAVLQPALVASRTWPRLLAALKRLGTIRPRQPSGPA